MTKAFTLSAVTLSVTAALGATSSIAGWGIRLETPRIEIPTPGQVVGAVTTVVNDAGKAVGQVATDVAKEAGIGLGNVAKEAQIGAGNVATTIRKAGSDTGAQLNRSQHDLEDAGTAIYRFAVNQVKGTQSALSNAEQRFRDGKVVDALFHLATEPLQTTDKSAAQAAQESALLSTVGSVAASAYGGPGGAAAYAAWLTFHQTGDINMAIRVGVIAGISSFANGKVATMPAESVTDSLKRAAVVGAIGGAAVAASGGDPEAINQAFLRGGSAILVQDGYKSVTERNFGQELGPATEPARCMAAPLSGAPEGCPGPLSYIKDKEGRLAMTDKDGNYHYVDVDKAGNVPADWRPIGNASTTPPGTPVVGIQTDSLPPLSQANEGSATMVALAKVPGMNAMALFHDRWAVAWEMNSEATKASIVPAIVLTYMGATVAVDAASTTAITDAARKSVLSHSPATPAVAPGAPSNLSAPSATPPLQPLLARYFIPVEGVSPTGLQPPTIRAVKPRGTPIETLICSRAGTLRVASVIPGKQKGDLQCLIYTETDGKASVPYISRNTPGYCAVQLAKMGTIMTNAGWQCRGR